MSRLSAKRTVHLQILLVHLQFTSRALIASAIRCEHRG